MYCVPCTVMAGVDQLHASELPEDTEQSGLFTITQFSGCGLHLGALNSLKTTVIHDKQYDCKGS